MSHASYQLLHPDIMIERSPLGRTMRVDETALMEPARLDADQLRAGGAGCMNVVLESKRAVRFPDDPFPDYGEGSAIARTRSTAFLQIF